MAGRVLQWIPYSTTIGTGELFGKASERLKAPAPLQLVISKERHRVRGQLVRRRCCRALDLSDLDLALQIHLQTHRILRMDPEPLCMYCLFLMPNMRNNPYGIGLLVSVAWLA